MMINIDSMKDDEDKGVDLDAFANDFVALIVKYNLPHTVFVNIRASDGLIRVGGDTKVAIIINKIVQEQITKENPDFKKL